MHKRRQAFDVLNVYRRQHVNVRVEQFEHIVIPFAVFAAFDVGMCEFVHQRNLGLARNNGINIHLFEERTLVIQFSTRHIFQSRREFRDAFASVGFHQADHRILTTAGPPNAFAQHVVGLADTGCITEKQLEDSLLFLRSSLV